MFPPEPGQDELNAPAHSEILPPSSGFSGPQFPPPEPAHFEVLAAGVQPTDASGGVDLPGGAQPRCECVCGKTFGRRQELRRHLDQVHKPQQMCPFKPCTYNWIRHAKIKAHIINDHADKFCPDLLEQIRKLRGKKMVEFLDQVLDAYDFDMPDTYVLPLPPLLEAPGASGIAHYIRCVFSGLRRRELFD
jgi:hypothetical protein